MQLLHERLDVLAADRRDGRGYARTLEEGGQLVDGFPVRPYGAGGPAAALRDRSKSRCSALMSFTLVCVTADLGTFSAS